jgi:hypothetical protein
MTSKRQPEWKLEITKAENGYVLRYLEELSDSYQTIRTEVIEEADTENGECEAAMALLHAVLNRFGVHKGIRIKAVKEK